MGRGDLVKVFEEWVNRDLVTAGVSVEGVEDFLAGGSLKFRMPGGLEVELIRSDGEGRKMFRAVRIGSMEFDDNDFIDVYLAVRVWARMQQYGRELLRMAGSQGGEV